MANLDQRRLLQIARELIERCFEAEYALLEHGIMNLGRTYWQIRAEKGQFTKEVNKIAKRL